MVKVSLSTQIAEAERHLAAMTEAAVNRPELADRLHAVEGIVLTLRFVETYEPGFRAYFASLSSTERNVA